MSDPPLGPCVFEGTAAEVHLRGEGAAVLTRRDAFSKDHAARVELRDAQIGPLAPGEVTAVLPRHDPSSKDQPARAELRDAQIAPLAPGAIDRPEALTPPGSSRCTVTALRAQVPGARHRGPVRPVRRLAGDGGR